MSSKGVVNSTPSNEQAIQDLDDIKVFARLYPVGAPAEQSLGELLENVNLSEYHRSFVQAKPYIKTPRPSPTSSEDEYDGSDSPSEPERHWSGHWILCQNRPGEIKPTIGWRVGRGTSRLDNRGVDLLVVPPGDFKYDIAVVQALIQFHPKSGVLMLRGVSETRPVELHYGTVVRLFANDTQVLRWHSNLFNLGKLQFRLEYEELDDDQYTKYIEIRNRSLRQLGGDRPHPRLHAMPRRTAEVVRDVILYEGISCGAFGFVHAGVQADTGFPVAMKEIWIKHQNTIEHKDIRNECTVSTSFKGAEGLLQAISIGCDHGHPQPCGKIPEKFWMTFPLASHDFSKQNWSRTSLLTVIPLLRGPLQGLKTLHEAGYMHRDVSMKNLLILSLHPPKAVLCDYGKAKHTPEHLDTRIGPIPTLAPEVDGRTKYTNKIDIWGIGYICCWIMFPEYQLANATDGSRPHLEWHKGIMKELSRYGGGGPSLRHDFADLVRRMLSWRPKDRPTAAQALQHPCMQIKSASPVPSWDPEEPALKIPKTSATPVNKKKPRDHPSPSGKPQQSPSPGRKPPLDGPHSGDTQLLTPGREPQSFE